MDQPLLGGESPLSLFVPVFGSGLRIAGSGTKYGQLDTTFMDPGRLSSVLFRSLFNSKHAGMPASYDAVPCAIRTLLTKYDLVLVILLHRPARVLWIDGLRIYINSYKCPTVDLSSIPSPLYFCH